MQNMKLYKKVTAILFQIFEIFCKYRYKTLIITRNLYVCKIKQLKKTNRRFLPHEPLVYYDGAQVTDYAQQEYHLRYPFTKYLQVVLEVTVKMLQNNVSLEQFQLCVKLSKQICYEMF